MSSLRRLVPAALIAALVTLAPGDAGAQRGILGRVKQKAAEKAAEKLVDKAARKPEQPATQQPAEPTPGAARQPRAAQSSQPAASETVRNDHVLEINAESLDRLQAALEAEAREIQVIKPMLARTNADFEKCQMDLTTKDAEYQKRYAAYTAALEKGDHAAARSAGQPMMDYMKEKCGEDPDNTTWRATLQARPRAKGLAAGSFTATQYDILKERIPPFCALPESATRGELVRAPGTGQNIHWAWTASEAAALRPRCAALTRALAAVS